MQNAKMSWRKPMLTINASLATSPGSIWEAVKPTVFGMAVCASWNVHTAKAVPSSALVWKRNHEQIVQPKNCWTPTVMCVSACCPSSGLRINVGGLNLSTNKFTNESQSLKGMLSQPVCLLATSVRPDLYWLFNDGLKETGERALP